MSVELNGLTMVAVAGATTVIGTTKGGWIHASQRPSYEAKTPAFYIMASPLTERQVTDALGLGNDDASDTAMQSLTSLEVNELAHHIMQGEAFKRAVADLEGKWELRCPTQAEWHAARDQSALALKPGWTERLADAPASNHRGAMMDGRPRPSELMGPAASQMAAIAVHPKNTNITAMTSVPHDRPLPNVVARLVLTPIRQDDAFRVPNNTDVWRNFRSEVVWTTLLGIVPSFLIPVLRGMSDYASEGWVNLLFGGLCAGFFTGALWRPSRPILRYDDVASSSDRLFQ
ncbi:MAG: hypothetical protein DWC10_05185 [Candidatus Poseidoniales archaeon]|nr:MAG: hypothetical protein DWC10_05185 [Candidatus Poseidoniales archaeon]